MKRHSKSLDEDRNCVREAFKKVHKGYSSDRVLADDGLNAAFVKECQKKNSKYTASKANNILLNMRKSTKLHVKTTERTQFAHDGYYHAAEIAARYMEDRYKIKLDRALCDPVMRKQFDKIAQQLAPDIDLLRLRLAALSLRKARRLRPELVKEVLTDKVTIKRFRATEIRDDPNLISTGPGIYIFQDKTEGTLYIGESKDLRERVSKHVDHSDRKSLAKYFWENGLKEIIVEVHDLNSAKSPRIKSLLKAYEGNLIAMRRPKFNIQGQEEES